MYIPDEIVDEVLRRCNIVDLISGYVSLQKKGSNYFGLCPFHNEKTGSFSVSESRQMFHCFGCGVSGSAYTFLMKYENFTFPEAVRFLAEKEGVVIPEGENPEEARKKESRRKQLLDVLYDAELYFFNCLRNPRGEQGLSYLRGRELTDETIKHFGLGYAPKNSREVIGYLKSKGHSDENIIAVGLGEFSEKYGMSGKFWNRVMFPIQDVNHRVIGFGGRVMGEGEPKYLNSQETEIFNKRNQLFGLNWARTSRKKEMILCEGYMDVISMHQAGFTQAVASLGTAFTEQQAKLISRYTKQVVLAYDSDEAGIKAALRAIGILRAEKMYAKVLSMQPYKDPDEFIKALGPEQFQKRIDEAENGFYFEIRMLERGFDLSDPDGKTQFHNEIAKKLCTFEDELQRENYLAAIAEKYVIRADILKDAVKRYAASGIGDREKQIDFTYPKPLASAKMRKDQLREEKYKRSANLLLAMLWQMPAFYKAVRDYISPKDFQTEEYQQIAEMLFQKLDAQEPVEPALMISRFEEEHLQQLAGEIFSAREEAMLG
ncbi:MAG: DNA primase, partial [Lachnospiraceae bacterium]|nr:DNA primase [Lachnospiraceae bacterium]